MRPEDVDPAYTSPLGFVIIGAIVLVSLAWGYGPGIVRELRGHRHMSMAEEYRGQLKVIGLVEKQKKPLRSMATRQNSSRFKMSRFDRILSSIFRGGSISGF